MPSPAPSTETKRSTCPLAPRFEQVLYAAQIAEPLLADGADERDAARRSEPLRRSARGRRRAAPPGRDNRRRYLASVSTDPDRAVVTRVSAGNTVSRCALNTRCGRAASPGRSPSTLPAESIRTLVSPSRSNACLERRRPALLSERRRRNLAQAHLLLDHVRFLVVCNPSTTFLIDGSRIKRSPIAAASSCGGSDTVGGAAATKTGDQNRQHQNVSHAGSSYSCDDAITCTSRATRSNVPRAHVRRDSTCDCDGHGSRRRCQWR